MSATKERELVRAVARAEAAANQADELVLRALSRRAAANEARGEAIHALAVVRARGVR